MQTFDPRKAIHDAKAFTSLPNWFFDDAVRCLPPYLISFWAYVLRQTVGYGRQRMEFSLREVQKDMGIPADTSSRCAQILDAIRMIEYTPGSGRQKSAIVVFPEGIPEEKNRRASFSAVMEALDEETKRGGRSGLSLGKLCEMIRLRREYWRKT